MHINSDTSSTYLAVVGSDQQAAWGSLEDVANVDANVRDLLWVDG